MNLYFRLIRILLSSLWRPPLRLLEESLVEFRVWPGDLDVNLHMTNGRYLALMDLGRVDLLSRMGALRLVVRRGWRPVAGSAAIRFRRPLKPFQKFQLRTWIVCWDPRWVFFEQRIECGGRVVAEGFVRATVRSAAGAVHTGEILTAMRQEAPSPPVPRTFQLWAEFEGRAGEQ